MSNQGVRGFYQIIETLRDQLLEDQNVNTVTTGDISDVNLQKVDIFPLAHIIVNNATLGEQTITFNISILAMDIVDRNKKTGEDVFLGQNNLQDILNTQLAVLNKAIQILRKGDLYGDKYQLQADPNCEPFYDRFDNELAGWTATMDIVIYNDINIC
jgi:hypothetical protein